MGKNIGFVSTRFAGTDGVSLEAAKWSETLEKSGHRCFWFAGELDRAPEKSLCVPEAFFQHERNRVIDAEIFGKKRRRRETTEAIHSLRAFLKAGAACVHRALPDRHDGRRKRADHSHARAFRAGHSRNHCGNPDSDGRPPSRFLLGTDAFRGQRGGRLPSDGLSAQPAEHRARRHQHRRPGGTGPAYRRLVGDHSECARLREPAAGR